MENYFKNYIQAVENPLPEMREYFDAENKYLARFCTNGTSALDVGCGNGRTMRSLAPIVKKIDGIDYSKDMINLAEANLRGIENKGLLLADFLTAKFLQPYDLVYASYNLLGSAETTEPKRILDKMISLTKTGGHTVASVWSVEGIEFARRYYPSIGIEVENIEAGNVHTNRGIFKRFSRKKIEDLAKQVGRPYSLILLTPIFYLLDIQN